MEQEKGRQPEPLGDEALDDAAGGTVTFGGSHETETGAPGAKGAASITDGTSHYGGFTGGVRVAVGDVNNDAVVKKIADGSVKPGG